jgi:hypothetical protein
MGEIRIGKATVKPDTPTHVPGIHEGNKKGNYKHMHGHKEDGTATARRSTGISPKQHEPILKIMPNLPPG